MAIRDEASGFPFPMITRQGLRGPLTFVSRDTVALIKSSLQQIILTVPGERMWLPEFGCRIKLMLFDSLTPTLQETLTNELLTAIQRWEPRVIVTANDILVQESQAIAASIEIRINFKVKNPDFTTSPSDSVLIVL